MYIYHHHQTMLFPQTLTVSEQFVLISRSAGLIGVHGQALDKYIYVCVCVCVCVCV